MGDVPPARLGGFGRGGALVFPRHEHVRGQLDVLVFFGQGEQGVAARVALREGQSHVRVLRLRRTQHTSETRTFLPPPHRQKDNRQLRRDGEGHPVAHLQAEAGVAGGGNKLDERQSEVYIERLATRREVHYGRSIMQLISLPWDPVECILCLQYIRT